MGKTSERFLDQELRFGAGNEHAIVDEELPAVERRTAADVLQRLAGHASAA